MSISYFPSSDIHPLYFFLLRISSGILSLSPLPNTSHPLAIAQQHLIMSIRIIFFVPSNEELLPQLISVHDALVVTEVPALVSDSCLPGISSLPVLLPPAFCSCHALLVPGLLPNCFIFVIILRCLGSKRGERRCAQEGLPTDSRAGDTEEQAGKARSAQEPRVMPAQRPAPNGPRQHGLDCSCPKPTVLNRSRENGDSMESYNFVTFGCTAVKPQQWCWQTSRCCSEVTRLKLDW